MDEESTRKDPAEASVRAQNPVNQVNGFMVVVGTGNQYLHAILWMYTFDQDLRVCVKTFTRTSPHGFKSWTDIKNSSGINVTQPKNLINIFCDLLQVSFIHDQVVQIL